ncbi:MAG: type II secretion system protein [Candidatus Omnitrophota bacterium]|nr:type II secretion system GspH family protein [Candidatus Omnitrophota bacterium]
MKSIVHSPQSIEKFGRDRKYNIKYVRAGLAPARNLSKKRMIVRSISAFTLLELLIVISIIAILAATMIPNFIGFDAEARLAASKTNLNSLRTRVSLFRTKEGRYPQELEELLEVTYNDMGVEKTYLDSIPPEFISSKDGNSDLQSLDSDEFLPGGGGWVYYMDKAKVIINWDMPLDSKWGKLEGEIPSEW